MKKVMFIVIFAVFSIPGFTQGSGTGVLKRAHYGSMSFEDIDVSLVNSTETNPKIGAKNLLDISNLNGDEIRSIGESFVQEVLKEESLASAWENSDPVNITGVVKTHRVIKKDGQLLLEWFEREAYPGEQGMRHRKTGITWWSRECLNFTVIKPKNVKKPDVVKKSERTYEIRGSTDDAVSSGGNNITLNIYNNPSNSTGGPSDRSDEYDYVYLNDQRNPYREVRVPRYQPENVVYDQSRRGGFNVNLNLDPGTIMMGIGMLRIANRGLAVYGQNVNYNINRNIGGGWGSGWGCLNGITNGNSLSQGGTGWGSGGVYTPGIFYTGGSTGGGSRFSNRWP